MLFITLYCSILSYPAIPCTAIHTLCSIFSVVRDKPVLQDGVLLRAGRVVSGDVSHLTVPPDEVGTLTVQRQEWQLLVPLEDVPESKRLVSVMVVVVVLV